MTELSSMAKGLTYSVEVTSTVLVVGLGSSGAVMSGWTTGCSVVQAMKRERTSMEPTKVNAKVLVLS